MAKKSELRTVIDHSEEEALMAKIELQNVDHSTEDAVMAKPKLQNITTNNPTEETVSNETAASAPNPFDMDSLRIDTSFIETTSVKKLLTTVPVHKPKSQEFVRSHPGEDYRDTYAMIELQEDNEFYVLTREMVVALPGEYFVATIYTYITRQGVVRLCPVKLPGPDGKDNEWNKSLRNAIHHVMKRWARIKSNRGLGAYEIFEAPATANIPDPVWPKATFKELLNIAFNGRVVDRIDHPLIRKLRQGS
jgi:hypothetical protein